MFGARITDGALHIWTGSPCRGTTEVYLVFDMGKPNAPALKLASTATEPGVMFEYLTIGGPYPGFDVGRALPANFDWRRAETPYLSVSGPPTTWNASTSLAEVVAGSEKHPADTYCFRAWGGLPHPKSPPSTARSSSRCAARIRSHDRAITRSTITLSLHRSIRTGTCDQPATFGSGPALSAGSANRPRRAAGARIRRIGHPHRAGRRCCRPR